jgi:hypothetical protein
VQLFDSYEDALEFTEDYDLDVARATLLEAVGRTTDAAELHFAEGRTFKAIRLLLDSHDAKSNLLASRYVLDGLWQNMSFGMPFDESNEVVSRLLDFSACLDRSRLPEGEREEVLSSSLNVSTSLRLT